MKTNKKILSAVLASTMMLSTLSSYVAMAETEPNGKVVEIGEGKTDATFPQTLEENATYKLASDISLTDTLIVNNSVTIDLNGHTLTLPKTGSGITVGKSASLTIKDSGTNGKIVNPAEKGSGYVLNILGTATMTGGTLENSSAKSYMVRIDGGTFTLEGGTIRDVEKFGCVKVEETADSKFIMNGGELNAEGAPAASNAGTFVHESGETGLGSFHTALINHGNTEIKGGVINGFVWACTWNLSDNASYEPAVAITGGKITGGLVIGASSKAQQDNAPKMTMSDGEFKGSINYTSQADNDAGNGINNNGTLSITGGKVEVTKFNLPAIDSEFTAESVTIGKNVDFTNNDADSKVNLTSIIKGNDNPVTMTGDELTRYKENKAFYNFSELETNADGNYTVTINSEVGKMKGETAAGTSGKNALLVLAFDKNDNIIIKKGDGVVAGGNAANGWQNTADKFVDNADTGKNTYFTLWISLTDERLTGNEKVEYTIISGEGAAKTEKNLTVKFKDTTEYTLTKDTDIDETNYGILVSTVDENGKATVTVNPANGKSITTAKVKYADGTEVTLTLDSNGIYTAEVEAKKFLTDDEIKNGTVDAKLKASNLEVTATAQSEDVVAKGITAAIADAPVEDTQKDRFKKNLELYKNAVTWNEASKTATVKVPAELMDGTGATGQGAANVCLVLELEKALVKGEDGSYGLSAAGIEDIDVEDGYKFAGKTEADKGKYVNLWIGAGDDAFTSGNTKTVVYTDKAGNFAATVNLVKVPGIKEFPAKQLSAITTVTTDAIIAQAKTNLGISSNANLDELKFTVGTLPTAAGEHEVEVTVTAKTGSECVLVNEDGKVVTELTPKVKVTITNDATAVVTIGAPANGTLTAKKADGTAIENGASVTVGTEITLSAAANSGYKFSLWNVTDAAGNSVTVTNNKFTMPAGGVTVSATFTKISSGGGGSHGGGGSYGGGGGQSTTTTVTLDMLPYNSIPNDQNAFSGNITASLKANGETTVSGVTLKTDSIEKTANGASVKLETPTTTSDINVWSREMVKNTPSSKAGEVKKSVDEAIKAVGDGKGFALCATITKNSKSVEPDGNVEITVPIPEAFKDKKLYAYRITKRGAVQVLARTADNKLTFMAGGSGEYIFTANKLKNVTDYKKGNVDLDKHTNAKDATAVLKHVVKINTLKDEKLFMADVNGDGYINAKDATEILKIVVGLV